jgi:parallel beta-helix repeat protein
MDIPRIEQKLLQHTDLPPIMALTALSDFEPLEEEQLKKAISPNSDFLPKLGKLLLYPTDKIIENEDNFSLVIDQAVIEKITVFRISNCKNFRILTELPEIQLASNNKFSFEISGCKSFSIEGLSCKQGRNIFFISNSSHFTIRNCKYVDAEGSGIIIYESSNFRVSDCNFTNILSAAILVIGNSSNGTIGDCRISHSRRFLNQDAGIHLCCTSKNITPSDIPEKYHEPVPIDVKMQRPHHIHIHKCCISHCRAQGIYLEGAVNCILEDNILLSNNKEGICFDWGSCYNIFKRNIVSFNGKRANLSKAEIKIDYIAEYPLLTDGSSSMKLPGISLDNGCMNLIKDNIIANNYGGGIKMIRTAIFNTITKNEMLYNDLGGNEFVPYFHSITILGLGAINQEFPKDRSSLLDFRPSILNTITGNTLIEHWKPIFSDRISSDNFIKDNYVPEIKRNQSLLKTVFNRALGRLRRFLRNRFHV